jgi:competence protein ComER
MHTGFIGIGSMGGMLVRAFLRSGALAPKDVWAANRSTARLDALAIEFPRIQIASNCEVIANCELVFVSVSAADTAAVLAQIEGQLHTGQLLVTTTAAILLGALEDRVPCRVAKLIPSITQEVSAGIALLMYGSRVTTEDRHRLENLLSRISEPVAIPESVARPAIGLASGGAALLAYLLQSMAEEAVRSNPELSPELAHKLVRETAGATARLLTEANMSTEEIVGRVAAPGSMTALGIEILSRSVPGAWQATFREVTRREAEVRKTLVL